MSQALRKLTRSISKTNLYRNPLLTIKGKNWSNVRAIRKQPTGGKRLKVYDFRELDIERSTQIKEYRWCVQG